MNCIAYLDNGKICGQPADRVDQLRGGAVCSAHVSPMCPDCGHVAVPDLTHHRGSPGCIRSQRDSLKAAVSEFLETASRGVINTELLVKALAPHDISNLGALGREIVELNGTCTRLRSKIDDLEEAKSTLTEQRDMLLQFARREHAEVHEESCDGVGHCPRCAALFDLISKAGNP